MGFGNINHLVDIWYIKRFSLYKNDTRNENSNTSTILGRTQCAKYNKCLLLTVLANRYNFQLSSGAPSGQHFEFWSVHRRSLSKSWLLLMCQSNIVVFLISATFAVSFRLVLSIEHEPEIAGPTTPATASTRLWQPECFHFPELK